MTLCSKKGNNMETIELKTKKGTLVAYAYENEDGYKGIRIELISDTMESLGNHPMVSLELTPDDDLQALIYDSDIECADIEHEFNLEGNDKSQRKILCKMTSDGTFIVDVDNSRWHWEFPKDRRTTYEYNEHLVTGEMGWSFGRFGMEFFIDDDESLVYKNIDSVIERIDEMVTSN